MRLLRVYSILKVFQIAQQLCVKYDLNPTIKKKNWHINEHIFCKITHRYLNNLLTNAISHLSRSN